MTEWPILSRSLRKGGHDVAGAFPVSLEVLGIVAFHYIEPSAQRLKPE
jgi:hypothetical protein